MFPIVIYNGKKKLTAKRSIDELIEKQVIQVKKYIPSFKYFLIDLATINKRRVSRLAVHSKNIAALLFKMETIDENKLLSEFLDVLKIIKEELPPELIGELKEYFMNMNIKQPETKKEFMEIVELMDGGQSMLEAKINNWLNKTREKAEKTGYKKGIKQGEKLGLEQGLERGKIESLKNVYKYTKDVELSAKMVGVSLEKAKEILEAKPEEVKH